MRYWVFQLFLVIFVCVELCISSYQKRIIGGEEAPPDKYRWAVSLKGNVEKLKVSGACGASILKTEGKTRWLVTAAHCFYPSDGRVVYDLTKPSLWHARIGITKVDFEYKKHGFIFKLKEKAKSAFNKVYKGVFGKKKFQIVIDDLHVKKVIIHPGYKPVTPDTNINDLKMDEDIALMKLRDSIPVDELESVSNVPLPIASLNMSWPSIGSECVVVGWGCTAPGQSANPIAKLAILKMWTNSECENVIPSRMFMNPISDFCAGYLKQKYGLCQGDSGSGLVCDYNGIPTIAGVVSRGNGGNPGDYPAVFTRVSSFTDWIHKMVREN